MSDTIVIAFNSNDIGYTYHLDDFHFFGLYEDIGVFIEDLTDEATDLVCRRILFTKVSEADDFYYLCSSFVFSGDVSSIRFADCDDVVYIAIAISTGDKIFRIKTISNKFKLCDKVE
jgi:hypothetical protein